jgi:hypothetical protein
MLTDNPRANTALIGTPLWAMLPDFALCDPVTVTLQPIH